MLCFDKEDRRIYGHGFFVFYRRVHPSDVALSLRIGSHTLTFGKRRGK